MARRWYELLMDDHEKTENVIAAMEKAFASPGGPSPEAVTAMVEYFAGYLEPCHNRKEEDFLFPLVESRGIPREGGPLGVMLMEHEQQRESLLPALRKLSAAYVSGDRSAADALQLAFRAYTGVVKDHFWKENDILYPMAMRLMNEADEARVIAGIQAVEDAIGAGTRERFYALADRIIAGGDLKDLSFGLERDVLVAILNALPVELSFVDAEDTVRYFSHEGQDKIFPRTRGAIGTKVQNCHPVKSVHVVNQILSDFKAGARDVAEFWIDFRAMKVHIRYFAVRAPGGAYLGSLEVVQNVTPMQAIAGEKRLMD